MLSVETYDEYQDAGTCLLISWSGIKKNIGFILIPSVC